MCICQMDTCTFFFQSQFQRAFVDELSKFLNKSSSRNNETVFEIYNETFRYSYHCKKKTLVFVLFEILHCAFNIVLIGGRRWFGVQNFIFRIGIASLRLWKKKWVRIPSRQGEVLFSWLEFECQYGMEMNL